MTGEELYAIWRLEMLREGDRHGFQRPPVWKRIRKSWTRRMWNSVGAQVVSPDDYNKINTRLYDSEQEIARLSGLLHESVISDHDGIPAVWVCELCGQPIGKGGRCNSAIHVGPEDGNAFNGHAIATTDLAAEYSAVLARERDLIVDNQNLASALRAIRGPSDAGPWIDVYVEAGGGYAGLQAVAGAALDMVEEAHAAS